MKTVRFTRLVQIAGRPYVHTLWVPPEKDPAFVRARDSHRLLTVHHAGAGRRNAGVVGFETPSTSGSQFLVFPRSLARYDGARVVGLHLDLLADAPSRTKPRKTPKANARRPATARAASSGTGSVSKRKSHRSASGAGAKAAPEAANSPSSSGRGSGPRSTPGGTPGGNVAHAETAVHSSTLRREIRAALKELEAGKSVAAYRRLERAVKAPSEEG